MDTNDTRAILEQAKKCYQKEYWSDALRLIDQLSCDMTENKDVMYMRALCLARMGHIEASELLCDQLDIIHHDSRGQQLKMQLEHAKREEKEKPEEKKPSQIPKILFSAIIIATVLIVIGGGIRHAINTMKNYVPEAIETATAPSIERTIDFGKSAVTGNLHTRKWSYDVEMPVRGDNFWKNIGEAIGKVTIPLGLELRLDASDATQVDFSGLRRLKANDLQSLDCEGSTLTDAELDNIVNLYGLRELSLGDTQVTELGIAKLRWMTSLWDFSVSGLNLGEQGWQVVESMPFLRGVNLDRTDVSDERLVALCSSAPLIEFLSLDENPQLTDTSLGELVKLQSLRNLFLSYTDITDKGLTRLQELDSMERIYLEGTRVTDASVAGFKNMWSLNQISLARTQITDAALEELKKIRGLTKLDISACPFLSEKAIEELREALPNCIIETDGNVTRRPAMWDKPV